MSYYCAGPGERGTDVSRQLTEYSASQKAITPVWRVICSCLGLAAACWFATGLLGITLLDIAKIWGNIKDVMIEVMSQTPPEWPMMMT